MVRRGDSDSRTAVIYARFSCSKQREASIDDQLRVCREWCEREGYAVVAEYCDHAFSGRSDNRPMFQEMIANAGESDIVLVYMMDRFSRSEYDAPIYKKELARHGVEVVSAMEALPDGPERVLIEKIYEGLAAVESAKTSLRTKRGMTGNAMKCMTNGVRIYGYRTGEDGRYEVVPEQAENVRECFRLRLRGDSMDSIARKLAERGVTTYTGRPCSGTMVNCMLKNERYTGVYIWDGVRVEGGIPAIIDRRTYMDAQNVRGRKRRKEESWALYPLAGKALCAECGKSLQGMSAYGQNGVRYEYYGCPGKCQRNVRRDLLEGEIVRAVRTMLRDPEAARSVAEALCAVPAGVNAEKDRASKALRDAERGLSNILAAVEQGIIVPGTKERIAQLEAQRARALADIDAASMDEVDPEDFARFLMQADKLDDASIIDAFVYQCLVAPESVVVTLNYDENGEPARLNIKRVRGNLEWCPV